MGFFGNLCIMMTTLYSVQAAQTVNIWRTVKTQHVLGQYYVTDFLYINHYDSQHKLHQTIKIQKFSTESYGRFLCQVYKFLQGQISSFLTLYRQCLIKNTERMMTHMNHHYCAIFNRLYNH